MNTITSVPVNFNNCGSNSCGCGSSCACKPGECKC
uniref:Metallothionein n=1 Tax=Paxillus involutus TaxID=71150 RepID=Q6QUK4_PAXIN|nr:metallothionein [Paxillus involutus]